jgi:hypothetical protein
MVTVLIVWSDAPREMAHSQHAPSPPFPIVAISIWFCGNFSSPPIFSCSRAHIIVYEFAIPDSIMAEEGTTAPPEQTPAPQ